MVCVCICIALMVIDFYFIIKHFRFERVNIILLAAISGILTADFSSGFVHWAADTWGSVDLPIVGKVRKACFILIGFRNVFHIFQNFLRPFREHHIDPTSITRHDFIETNGDNFMVVLPVLFKLTWDFATKSDADIQITFATSAYLYLCVIFVAMTNQVS